MIIFPKDVVATLLKAGNDQGNVPIIQPSPKAGSGNEA
jgi:hypothetical protein